MKIDKMRPSENVEDRRGLKSSPPPKAQMAKAVGDDDADLPSPGRGGGVMPNPGDDDTLNPHLIRPETSGAAARRAGFSRDYGTQKVKSLPELGLLGTEREDMRERLGSPLGYEKGGPVVGAKKHKNKGYRPF